MYWWWKLGFSSKVEKITITRTLELINSSSLEVVWCIRIFHDNEMRKLRLCSRNPHDWTAQTLKRAYTGLNHTGTQARIYVYVEENVQTPLSILFLIRPSTNSFHIFFFYQTSLSHKLIQFIQDSQPSFFFLVLISRF